MDFSLNINGNAATLADFFSKLAAVPTITATLEQFETTTATPQIGEIWPGQGGIYAGLSRGIDGARDAHIILAVEKPDGGLAWDAAVAWAKTVNADACTDFRLPTRAESALLYANLKDQFEAVWHWTGEEYTQYSRDLAWGQDFGDGTQYNGVKGYEGRARAVRRFIP